MVSDVLKLRNSVSKQSQVGGREGVVFVCTSTVGKRCSLVFCRYASLACSENLSDHSYIHLMRQGRNLVHYPQPREGQPTVRRSPGLTLFTRILGAAMCAKPLTR